MLTEIRGQKEQELMQSVFPQFRAFSERFAFGFDGCLNGPKTGRLYHVIVEADPTKYPQCPPGVRMDPEIADHWVDHRGRRTLCMIRDWQPARSTFANTVLAVVKFLAEHDGTARTCAAEQIGRPRSVRQGSILI